MYQQQLMHPAIQPKMEQHVDSWSNTLPAESTQLPDGLMLLGTKKAERIQRMAQTTRRLPRSQSSLEHSNASTQKSARQEMQT